MQMEIAQLIGREIATAMNENREAVQRTMLSYLKSAGETASTAQFTVSNLNAEQVLIEGEAVTEQAATFLRGAGFDVLHSGTVAVAKTNAKRVNSARGGANPQKVGELRYFNDDKSIRDARKMFQTLVEAKDWRYFPQFLKEIDNLIANARVREGHNEDDDANEGLDASHQPAPIVKNEGTDRAVAGTEETPEAETTETKEAAPAAA